MAISTPERNPGATLSPTGLGAPRNRRTRKATEKSIEYRNTYEHLEASSDESDAIQVKDSQPILRVKKTTTNKDLLATLTEIIQRQNDTITNLGREITEIKKQQQTLIEYNINLIDEITELKTRVDGLSAGSQGTRSWASVVAETPLGSNATSGTSASHKRHNTARASPADIPYVTVDTSKAEGESNQASAGTVRAAVEKEIRTIETYENWRCRAVTVDQRNQSRIRIACRNEAEHELVKKAAEKIGTGTRVLRDELFPIKVDHVKRTAVLDENDAIREGAAEAFSEENETTVAKIAWLSKKDVPKAYGSMVVYLTKGSDARRLVAEGFFHAGGESGTTSVFERRPRPNQCFNCQEIGHKAYQCKNTQKCARCAKEAHNHRNCSEPVLKCVPCGGPHESFSRNCRKLYPQNE
jgi:FtsZ-binding cell division protein ZapB